MAEREFTITELKRAGDGGYVDLPVKFTWTNSKRSAPRGSWRFGLEQRSVREDYPGAQQPVEQVLGPNYTEFSINGLWDDRYNFQGFALDTMRKFELLTQRGSLCRFEFESISITGLIKNCNFDYKRADNIGYTFSVSPHYRTAAGLPTITAAGERAPQAFKPVTQYRDEAFAAKEDLNGVVFFAPAKQMKGSRMSQHLSSLGTLQAKTQDFIDAIDQRLEPGAEAFADLKRLAATLDVIKGQSFQIMFDLAAAKSDVSLAWENAVAVLDFDVWRTQSTQVARKLGLLGVEGRIELSRRAEPKAVALYRPRAGESLYSISQRFYGTPGAWTLIATRNGLTTITLQGTELLIIPERS